MNQYKIFVESMQQAGIDTDTIEVVAAIHNAIYEAAENDSDDDNKEEPDEKNLEPEETASEAANEANADEGAKAIMYNLLTLMNAKQNAYQQYHWNAESKSLHEKAQECYELYQETKDKVAETLQATYNENIDFKVWSGKIPNLTDKGAFLASVDEDLDKISEFRSQLEHFETFGLNGTLDGFIDELTGIKYHLIRFFENKDV